MYFQPTTYFQKQINLMFGNIEILLAEAKKQDQERFLKPLENAKQVFESLMQRTKNYQEYLKNREELQKIFDEQELIVIKIFQILFPDVVCMCFS